MDECISQRTMDAVTDPDRFSFNALKEIDRMDLKDDTLVKFVQLCETDLETSFGTDHQFLNSGDILRLWDKFVTIDNNA